jgi:type VI secretion system secreted protein Hcp
MAVVDYFLKIGDIKGESQDDKHPDEIQVESWSMGATNSGTGEAGGGAGGGRSDHQDMHFTAKMSKASPKLFLACATGQAIDKAVLTVRKAGKDPQEYLKITLTNVFVSSYQTGGSGQEIVPTDQFSLNFSKIEKSYAPQKDDGSLDSPIVHNYDLKKNKGG